MTGRRRAERTALGLAIALALATLGYAALWPHRPAAAETHFADASDIPTVLKGKGIYARYCASCHGRRLQGQPLWQLMDEYAGRRAPAFDETGHSWQHADEDLFHMIKYGRFAAAPPDYHSYMPAFKDFLSDDEILAALAFVKARLPLGLRVSQSTLNPDNAGMPANADTVDWRLPPTCNATLRLTQPSQ
jgi:mono/diheme cytochrome c family protein